MQYPILFSAGLSTYDNQPSQVTCSSFEEFSEWLLTDRCSSKGMRYLCAPLTTGTHDQPEKYPGQKTWRLKKLAMPRRFIAFDIDGCRSTKDFMYLREFLTKWQCILYTTASHTDENPRARIIAILRDDIFPGEDEKLGVLIQSEIEMALGMGVFKFDSSVYKAIQPVFTPLIGASVDMNYGEPIDPSKYRHFLENASLTPIISKTGFEIPEAVPVGQRNSTILQIVGRLRSSRFTEPEIYRIASAYNRVNLAEPLPQDELLGICNRYSHQGLPNEVALIDCNSELGNVLLKGSQRSVPKIAPPTREYVFANIITPGTLTVLGGSGGVSKTMLAMQICVASAAGVSLGDINVAEGSSVLVLGEEDDAECDRRLGGICSHFGIDTERVEKRILCAGAAGVDIRFTRKVDSNSFATELESQLIEVVRNHADHSGCSVKFIVVDHARLALGGDPNFADDVTQLTRVLTNIARSTGAAVILLAHSPKAVLAKSGSEINAADIAGSSAFVDNARSAFMAWGMREDEAKTHLIQDHERQDWVRLQNVKANYGLYPVS